MTRLGGVRLVGSFGEVHAGGIKLWGIRIERRVNLEYQALRKQVTGSSFGDEAGGIKLEVESGLEGIRLAAIRLGRSRWERKRLEGIGLGVGWGYEAGR